ncbi:hypothetical protein C0J52_24632 [Blattella germanica]|nr:hypothetical protein C0J52_24632 [Blattella germanica]
MNGVGFAGSHNILRGSLLRHASRSRVSSSSVVKTTPNHNVPTRLSTVSPHWSSTLVPDIDTNVCGFDVNSYSNVSKWFTKIKKTLPGYEDTVGAGTVDFLKVLNVFKK